MEVKDVYSFFGKPRMHDNKIRRIESTLEGLRACLYPGGINYEKDRVQTSLQDTMTEIFCRIDELERELKKEQQEKGIAVLKIDQALMKVPEGPYRTILAEYYIGRISIGKIADGMGISVRHAYRVLKKAVETFCEIMNREQMLTDVSAEVIK